MTGVFVHDGLNAMDDAKAKAENATKLNEVQPIHWETKNCKELCLCLSIHNMCDLTRRTNTQCTLIL